MRDRELAAANRSLLDPIALELACAGEPVHLTIAERAAAIARLDGYGLSAREISERLHIAERTVVRHRRLVAP